MAFLDKILDKGDDVAARLIMKASAKQARMNALLEEDNADVRVVSFDLQMGIPPSVSYSIESIDRGSSPE